MKPLIATAIGKTLRQVTRLRGGSGQAMPGLIIEKLFPAYFASMLQQLPEGVVVVTGTNGKTTTTKMVVELLQGSGKRVLTNPSGSNMTRGINSALIEHARPSGHLPFDIAVLELDEAYAREFVQRIRPRWVLVLNVTRDQLDRFGEVDTAASMLAETMRAASEGIVTNADDPRLVTFAQSIEGIAVKLFGVSDKLRAFFPSDAELVAVGKKEVKTRSYKLDVELTAFTNRDVTYTIEGRKQSTTLRLNGQHNFQNAAAALTLVRALMPSVSAERLVEELALVEPAFGRGQVYTLANGSNLRLVLVKNPSGFRQALASYLPSDAPILIAINDNIADGRDISWLWDVDFEPLRDSRIYCTSGTRAPDMALRLEYDDCKVERVEPDLAIALRHFSDLSEDKILFATYTAMTWLHKRLEQEVEAGL